MRELGSRAVSALVSFFFMPSIRAQNESRREPPSGCGRLSVPPVSSWYDRRPFSFRPPLGFLPSARCHAGVPLVAFREPLASLVLMVICFYHVQPIAATGRISRLAATNDPAEALAM